MLNQQIPQVFTLILYGWAVFSSEYIKRKTTDNLVIDGFLLVIRLVSDISPFYRYVLSVISLCISVFR